MSASSPKTGTERSLWEYQLGGLPFLRRPLRIWKGLILANTAARREAKAVLFAELAEAAKQGMPLELALAMNSQSLREAKRGPNPALASGANRRNLLESFLSGAAMYIFAQLAMFFYILLSIRLADVERIARLLSLRLHEHVSKGLSLSEAMRRCGPDYDEQEIRLAEAGEQWGNLPKAIQRLAEFQVTEARLSVQGSRMLYPIFLGMLLAQIAAFCVVFIVPKFKDIYDQMGAELPEATRRVIEVSYWLINGPGVVLLLGVTLLLFYLVVRALMNGNRLSKYILIAPLVGVLAGFVMMGATALIEELSLYSVLQNPLLLIAFVVISALVLTIGLVIVVPEILASVEMTVLRMERRFAPLVRRLPLVGAAARAEAEARWLAALAVALESGVAAPDAVQSAGRVCGGPLEKRSEQAALDVRAGHTIGQAAVKHQLLRPEINHRLVLLDSYRNYPAGLRAIADDMSVAAYEQLARGGRLGEVVVLLTLGILVTFFAISLYLPLFNIPNIVIHAKDL